MALSQEEAADRGFHLVEELAGGFKRFERVLPHGTQVVVEESIEKALERIEDLLNIHPGAPGHGVSARSDGALESRDDQAAQSVAAGANGPSPAADAEAAKAAAEAEAEPEPEAPAEPEAAPSEDAPEAPEIPAVES